MRSLLCDLEIPVVLDADGINALSGHIDSLDRRRATTVMTPHAGEFVRLTGCALPIQDRVTAAGLLPRITAARWSSRGGALSLPLQTAAPGSTAPGIPAWQRGGSGDVLAG